jgi:iron complex transport system substrate-binding protein
MNPTTLDEVLNVTVEVGDAIGRGGEARERVSTLRKRLARVEEAVVGLPRPRVGCIEWLYPPFSAGHWVPDMVRLAGGEELFARSGEPSKRLSWEGILKAAPEVLVLMPCGFDATRAAREARRLLEISGWEDIPAVEDGRVWTVDANSYYSRPAPRLVEGVETLARILHPEVFPEAPEPEAAARLSYAFG